MRRWIGPEREAVLLGLRRADGRARRRAATRASFRSASISRTRLRYFEQSITTRDVQHLPGEARPAAARRGSARRARGRARRWRRCRPIVRGITTPIGTLAVVRAGRPRTARGRPAVKRTSPAIAPRKAAARTRVDVGAVVDGRVETAASDGVPLGVGALAARPRAPAGRDRVGARRRPARRSRRRASARSARGRGTTRGDGASGTAQRTWRVDRRRAVWPDRSSSCASASAAAARKPGDPAAACDVGLQTVDCAGERAGIRRASSRIRRPRRPSRPARGREARRSPSRSSELTGSSNQRHAELVANSAANASACLAV